MLRRYSADETRLFIEVAHAVVNIPNAPLKQAPTKSDRINRLESRWKAREIVRKLYPYLTPNDPEYHRTVDSVEHQSNNVDT